MKKVFLKLAINELVQNEAQMGRMGSAFQPKCWAEDQQFKPGETRFVSWYLTDLGGNIVGENVSFVENDAGYKFNLPATMNTVPMSGQFETTCKNPSNNIILVVSLIPAPAGTC